MAIEKTSMIKNTLTFAATVAQKEKGAMKME